jgi:predicted transcriptional regulator
MPSHVLMPRKVVCDHDLTAADIRLYAVLLEIKKEDHTVADGLDALAAKVGVTKFTVIDSVKKLVDRGFLKKQLRGCHPFLLTVLKHRPREVVSVG